MNDKLFQRIKELTQMQATSGNEQNVRDYLRECITSLVDEVTTDGLGGIFGIRHHQNKEAPRVMVAAHMDEVGFIMLKNMHEFLLDMAHTHNIPYQYYVSKGNTDASAAHLKNNGVPSSVIGVVARYIHSHQTLFNITDFEAAQELLVQVIKSLDKSTVDTIYGR
ncbi:MAG: hypothetical protein LBF32_02660 [Streptococcaceae bacterium]|jgi:putative aminopeptidase FrvX|nr:hypothetical protein [Streptococcaceae bacterium]